MVWKMHAYRLYAMGVITTKKSLVQLEKLSTASFCRRRLSVVLVRLRMSETLKEACTFIEQVGALCTNVGDIQRYLQHDTQDVTQKLARISKYNTFIAQQSSSQEYFLPLEGNQNGIADCMGLQGTCQEPSGKITSQEQCGDQKDRLQTRMLCAGSH